MISLGGITRLFCWLRTLGDHDPDLYWDDERRDWACLCCRCGKEFKPGV